MINITGNIDLTLDDNKPDDEQVIIILKGYGDSGESLDSFKERLEIKDQESKDDITFSNLNEFLNEQKNYYFHNGLAAWDIIDTIQEYHSDGIDNTEAGYLFCIMKYLLRYPYKGDSEGDLEKSIKYIERIIDHIKL